MYFTVYCSLTSMGKRKRPCLLTHRTEQWSKTRYEWLPQHGRTRQQLLKAHYQMRAVNHLEIDNTEEQPTYAQVEQADIRVARNHHG